MRRHALGLALSGALVWLGACGPDRGPQSWIAERAAAVQCTTAGRHRQAPMLLDLPSVQAPLGFYARRLDPMALNQLGFQRERVACAILEAPSEETIAAAQANIEAFSATQVQVDRAAFGVGGRCTCDIADAIDLRGVIARCTDRASQAGCDIEGKSAAMREALAPTLEAMRAMPLPVIHWRLVGRQDRPGYFAKNRAELLERYPAGSVVYTKSDALPTRLNAELVAGLFEVDGVVAVVRQRSGRELLVVRERRGQLVLDHFAYPVVSSRRAPMLPVLDNLKLADYLAMLSKPEQTRSLALAPGKGNLYEFDGPLLDDVDRFIDALGPLGELPRAPEAERAEPLVDRITLQAPFGHDGEVLKVRATLSSEGQRWAQSLTSRMISPSVDELNSPTEPPPSYTFNDDSPYVRREQPVDAYVLRVWSYLGYYVEAIELEFPGSIRGRADAWTFSLPRSLARRMPATAPFSGARSVLSKQPMTFTAEFDTQRTTFVGTLAPQ